MKTYVRACHSSAQMKVITMFYNVVHNPAFSVFFLRRLFLQAMPASLLFFKYTNYGSNLGPLIKDFSLLGMFFPKYSHELHVF